MEEQYREAKIEFLKSSLRKDENQSIDNLKKIIEIGKILKKDTRPDEKKLQVILNRQKVSQSKTKTVSKSPTPVAKTTPQPNQTTQTNQNSNSVLYSIQSVTSVNNSIIVKFNTDIKNDDIKFFELKPEPLYRDVFDIKGYFKDALATKLAINGDEKITIGQFQPDVLRVVISGESNPDTSFTLNNKELVISVNSTKSKSASIKQEPVAAPIITKPQEQSSTNSLIDLQSSIRSIESVNNQVIIKFNKKFTKNDLKHNFFKQNNNFENIFDIKGNYKYVMPTKLEINSIDKIITTEQQNSVRIRFINKANSKIVYSIGNNELIITVQESANSSNNTNQVATTQTATPTPIQTQAPRQTFNKVIVIDAGHGGDDVGAVGPNKRYEKVINFEVTKYLENILKQRGYKVYLTRTNDKFIKVMDRTILANQKNADLFLSIHTNSMPKEKAATTSGIETFFLSPARSERAKRVAALENKTDIREMSESSKSVFLESLNRPRITASHKFAIDVQSGILQAARTKYKNVNDSGVKEGPFWVLVGAQMPSILIELGFVSHPEESKRLYEKDYQQLLANGIANGIDSYFSKNP